MTSKLNAMHLMGYHWDDSDKAFVARTRPRSIKVFQDQWRDPFFLEWMYTTTKSWGTLIVLRDHPLSEQHERMHRDPEGTGRAHADEWAHLHVNYLAPIKDFDLSRTLFLGLNEPDVTTPASTARVVRYTVAFLDRLKEHGLKGGALNLSVGWPDNSGPDTPVNWQPFEPVHQAIQRGGHYLFLHEYFANWRGLNLNKGWWVDRLGQCPWDVPIIVGEAGADNYVDYQWATTVNDSHRRGWSGYSNVEDYLAMVEMVDNIYRRDHRIHSAMLFTYDFAHPWGSFDVRSMREQLAAYYERKANEPAGSPLAFPRYPANVNVPTPPAPVPTPTGVRLRVPYVSQLPPHDSEPEDGDCGIACATALIQALTDASATVDRVEASIGLTGPYARLGILKVQEAARKWGVPMVWRGRSGAAEWRNLLDNGRAFILLVDYKSLPRRYNATYDDGHFVLVHGYEGSTFYYDDPFWPVPFGEDIAISEAALLNAASTTRHFNTPRQLLTLSGNHALPRVEVPLPAPPKPNLNKVRWALEHAARVLRAEGLTLEHDYIINSDFYQSLPGAR